MKETTQPNQLSHQIIGGAIEVHRLKGTGLIETIYQRCMERELDLRELTAVRQMEVDIEYKGLFSGSPLSSTCWWRIAFLWSSSRLKESSLSTKRGC